MTRIEKYYEQVTQWEARQEIDPSVFLEVARHAYALGKTENSDILLAAARLVDAVERYARQECLRSELMRTKDTLKTLLK